MVRRLACVDKHGLDVLYRVGWNRDRPQAGRDDDFYTEPLLRTTLGDKMGPRIIVAAIPRASRNRWEGKHRDDSR